ncbi:MAG: flagellar motor protein PomA [Desulfatitalea sp.]|nr:MotA/TolQ/ExbB proton channel family protein [Desulfatitalea sp.]NNK02558.1 flagellar motor protein PomA [Desulfatitalea sp.]
MDIATIIGLISGTVLIVSAVILGGSPVIFINIPSALIVVGGTIAVTFIKFTMSDVLNSIAVAMKAFLVKTTDAEAMIEEMVNFTRIAKKEGLIALEKEEAADPFAAKALRYLSDGYDENLIEDMLSKDIRLTIQRHTTGQNVFKGMGDSAPAFGMIGTLIGLVQMLSSMDDPASIGPSMAVALLTTLYGAVLANFIFIPLSEKLALRSEHEKLNKSIIVEAAIGINRGVSPMVLEESLKIFLSPKQREHQPGDENAPEAEAEAA